MTINITDIKITHNIDTTRPQDYQGVYLHISQEQSLLWSLHSLHLQLSGIQDLMRFLKIFRLGLSFKFLGSIVFHTIGPKIRRDPWPILVVRANGMKNLSLFSLYEKISFINGGLRSFFTLYISVAKQWILRWWILKDSSSFSNSSNFLYTILKPLSWSRLIFLFIFLLQNIQTKGQ